MDCITTAVSRGTDTPGRPGKVTALDFLYQVKTHRHWDFCFCFLSLVLWDDSTEIMELTSKMKSVYLSQNILATSGCFKLKKKEKLYPIQYNANMDISSEIIISPTVKFQISLTFYYSYFFVNISSCYCCTLCHHRAFYPAEVLGSRTWSLEHTSCSPSSSSGEIIHIDIEGWVWWGLGGDSRGREHMYTYGKFMVLYGGSQHKNVNQLSSNKKFKNVIFYAHWFKTAPF